MSTPGYGNVPVEFLRGTGPFYGTGSRVSGTAPPTVPTYGLDGQPSTSHAIQGSVKATTTTLAIAFPSGLGFTSPNYSLIVTDTTTGAYITAYLTRTPAGFSFTSVAGNVYAFYAVGT